MQHVTILTMSKLLYMG